MKIFRFKKFNVVNERSAMKVNTDGVLLGAAMTLTPSDCRLLDIGTGTGTIALMAAQRLTDIKARCFASGAHSFSQNDMKKSGGDNRVLDAMKHTPGGAQAQQINEAAQSSSVGGESLREGLGRTLSREADCIREQHPLSEASAESLSDASAEASSCIQIDAIDIDEPSASEAKSNFEQSPWAANLCAHNLSLDDFAATLKSAEQGVKYDLIFSNPPYFEDSLIAPDERKSTARHTSEGLSYRDIFDFAQNYLTENGRVALVLPADQEFAICRYARMSGMHLFKILRVRTVPRKSPSRIIIEFSKQRPQEVEDTILTIQNEGQYTQEYLSLTKEFYLFA